jgi:hypothetical protein
MCDECDAPEVDLELERLRVMIRKLCNIVAGEYPESDDRYEFAMNCLTDVGEE